MQAHREQLSMNHLLNYPNYLYIFTHYWQQYKGTGITILRNNAKKSNLPFTGRLGFFVLSSTYFRLYTGGPIPQFDY